MLLTTKFVSEGHSGGKGKIISVKAAFKCFIFLLQKEFRNNSVGVGVIQKVKARLSPCWEAWDGVSLLLSRPHKCWNCRRVPLYLASLEWRLQDYIVNYVCVSARTHTCALTWRPERASAPLVGVRGRLELPSLSGRWDPTQDPRGLYVRLTPEPCLQPPLRALQQPTEEVSGDFI